LENERIVTLIEKTKVKIEKMAAEEGGE